MYHIFVSIWISRQPENNLPNLNQMSRKLFGVKAMTRLVAMAKPIQGLSCLTKGYAESLSEEYLVPSFPCSHVVGVVSFSIESLQNQRQSWYPVQHLAGNSSVQCHCFKDGWSKGTRGGSGGMNTGFCSQSVGSLEDARMARIWQLFSHLAGQLHNSYKVCLNWRSHVSQWKLHAECLGR